MGENGRGSLDWIRFSVSAVRKLKDGGEKTDFRVWGFWGHGQGQNGDLEVRHFRRKFLNKDLRFLHYLKKEINFETFQLKNFPIISFN